MIYFWDFIFIGLYLASDEIITRIQNKSLRWYLDVRSMINWAQFILIALYFYIRPYHTDSEKGVCFCLFLFTKFVFDIVFTKNCTNEYIDKIFSFATKRNGKRKQ